METRVVSPRGKEVVIGDGRPTVLIGERINPFGKGPLKQTIKTRDMEPIRREASSQAEAGADILILSMATFGIDEAQVLPRVADLLLGKDSKARQYTAYGRKLISDAAR